MEEIWKPVYGYEDYYDVSNNGEIKIKRDGPKKGCLIKHRKDSCGYRQCMLSGLEKRKSVMVHRVVMASFFGPSDLEVDHINHIRDDNRLENLRYVTHKENVRHSKNYRRRLNGFESKNWSEKKIDRKLEIVSNNSCSLFAVMYGKKLASKHKTFLGAFISSKILQRHIIKRGEYHGAQSFYKLRSKIFDYCA